MPSAASLCRRRALFEEAFDHYWPDPGAFYLAPIRGDCHFKPHKKTGHVEGHAQASQGQPPLSEKENASFH